MLILLALWPKTSSFLGTRQLGNIGEKRLNHLTGARNRPMKGGAVRSLRKRPSLSLDHACHFVEQTLSRRTFQDRSRPLRHQADQEGCQDHPLFRAAAGFPEEG